MTHTPYNFILSPVRTFFGRIFLFLSVAILFFALFYGDIAGDKDAIDKTLFIVDTSLSMSAEDIVGSGGVLFSRLDGAKELLTAYSQGAPRALFTFADSTRLQLPFSLDDTIWDNRVQMLRPIEYGSPTDISLALANIALIYPDDPLHIILITDGENTTSTSTETGITLPVGSRLTIVGIGTPTGARIVSHYDAEGKVVYKKYDGKDVVSRLDEAYLETMSDTYDADIFFLQKTTDTATILSKLSRSGGKKSTLPYTSFLVFFGCISVVLALMVPDYHKR